MIRKFFSAALFLTNYNVFCQQPIWNFNIVANPTSIVLNQADTVYSFGCNFQVDTNSVNSVLFRVGLDSTSNEIYNGTFNLFEINSLPFSTTFSRVGNIVNINIGQKLSHLYYFQIAAVDTSGIVHPFIIKNNIQ